VRSKSALGWRRRTSGLLTDIVCCPGGDFMLARNAKSLPIAQAIQERFDDADYVDDLGDLTLNMSAASIRAGTTTSGTSDFWVSTRRGRVLSDNARRRRRADPASRVGSVIGPSFSAEQVPA